MRHPHRPGLPAPSTALLLVAHGSRDGRHAATMSSLHEAVRRLRPGLRAEIGYLEFDTPRVGEALARLGRGGPCDVVATPLLLTSAFHAKTDIPQTLREATAELPGLRVAQADVLGPDPLLPAAMERRLVEAGLDLAEAATTGVVLAAAGSSDPGAVASVEALAERWRRDTGFAAVRTAYASAALPRTADAVRELRAEPAVRRVAVAPYVLAPGRLPDRIVAGAREGGADVLAPTLGVAPELVRLVLRRFDATAGATAGHRAA